MAVSTGNVSNHIGISKFDMVDQQDLTRIESDLNSGQIMFINTAPFFENYSEDVVTLKNTLDQIKALCATAGGQLGRVGEDVLVITPNHSIKLF